MTDKQLRDEVMTLLLAGHETTALALSWAWYLLATYPEAQAKLQEEVDRVLCGRLPSASDVAQLTYTNNVVREAMRLYPPAYVMTRRAAETVEIGGYVLPAESNVILSPWVCASGTASRSWKLRSCWPRSRSAFKSAWFRGRRSNPWLASHCAPGTACMCGSTSGDGRVPDLGIPTRLVWQPCGIFWREYLPALYNGSMGQRIRVPAPSHAQRAGELVL
jgi:hypothetical protein